MINKNGKIPDPAQARAIKDMPAPENVSSLQNFPGLANYHNVFVPNTHCL